MIFNYPFYYLSHGFRSIATILLCKQVTTAVHVAIEVFLYHFSVVVNVNYYT